MRGLVPAEPLDGRTGPEGISRGQRAAALRRHVPGVRALPDPVTRLQARGGRVRVRRAPRPRGSRGRRRGPCRPLGVPVLPVRVPVLRHARPAPGPDTGSSPARRVLRRGLPPENVPAGLGCAHRFRRAGAGHVLQRLGRFAGRRDRVLRRPRMGLSRGHSRHGGRIYVGQGNRTHGVGRLRRIRHTVREQVVVEQGTAVTIIIRGYIRYDSVGLALRSVRKYYEFDN